MSDFTGILKQCFNKLGITYTDKQIADFEIYFNLLREWNEKMNLTAITDNYGVAVKHFTDSVSVLQKVNIKQGASIIDVGTGAGFPGIPIKIMRPDIKLTLLDSLNKRLIFLNEVCAKLDIDAVTIHSRAEEGARNAQYREAFDYSVSRAVASMNVLAEYCLPYVKCGGSFISMKGYDCDAELDLAKNALKTLGGKIVLVSKFSLPDDSGRTVIEVSKVHNTPKAYPRQSGKISKQPL